MISLSASSFLTSVPSILAEKNNLQNGACAFWQMPECYVLPPSPRSAEIRGFKVLSHIPMKELPICFQVIRGKQSCVPRLGHAKHGCSHRAPGSPVIQIIWKHRGLAGEAVSAAFDLFSNTFIYMWYLRIVCIQFQSWLCSSCSSHSLILCEIHRIQFTNPHFGNVCTKTEPSAAAAELQSWQSS